MISYHQARKAYLISLKTGKIANIISDHENYVACFAFTQDSRYSLTGDAKGKIT